MLILFHKQSITQLNTAKNEQMTNETHSEIRKMYTFIINILSYFINAQNTVALIIKQSVSTVRYPAATDINRCEFQLY